MSSNPSNPSDPPDAPDADNINRELFAGEEQDNVGLAEEHYIKCSNSKRVLAAMAVGLKKDGDADLLMEEIRICASQLFLN